jgi:peptide/nickel transport system permease protein
VRAILTPRSLLHKRQSFAALSVLVTMILVSVFADFFASSLPVFAVLENKVHVLANVIKPPALTVLSRSEMNAACAKGFCIRAVVASSPKDPSLEILLPPFRVRAHPLGTDALGRDVFAVAVHGTRAVVSFALLAVLFLVSLGTFLGAIAGFFGGFLDGIISRAVETMTAFPTLVLVLAVQALIPNASSFTLLLAISLTRWAEVARVVRAEVLDVMNEDYALAARALGATPLRVLWRHVLPNARSQVIVAGSFALSAVVLLQASCDFLGVGNAENLPTWGLLMGQAKRHPEAWWLMAFPSSLLLLMVVAQTVISEALRLALDPKA